MTKPNSPTTAAGSWAASKRKLPKKIAKRATPTAVQKEFYSNGTLKSVGRKSGRQRHGPWKFYHRDGKLWSSGRYENGVTHGLFKWYAANGTLRQSGRFDHGEQTGLWKRYYGGTTQLYDVGNWAAGKRVGVWKTYDRKGTLKRTQTFGRKA